MRFPLPPTLRVEALEDRLVPSASLINLTTHGATATTPSGAVVSQIDALPAGSTSPFVRLQEGLVGQVLGALGIGAEEGYNTDARPFQYDQIGNSQVTHALTLGQVPVVNVNGVAYREFVLDVNQYSWAPNLSLNQVQVYLGDTGNLKGYNANTKKLGGQSPVFDLDAGGDVTIKLNGNLNTGGGSGDMTLLVPDSAFAGAGPNKFVYLYSNMGMRGASADGGFEEWSVRTAPPAAVTPSGSLSGGVFVDQDGSGTMDPGEGVANVNVQLLTTDPQGNTVTYDTTTDADGHFAFNNLAPGTYTLIENGQSGSLQVTDETVGTLGGTPDTGSQQITDIAIGSGQSGTGYQFQNVFAE